MSFASPHADVELPGSGLHAFLSAHAGPADLDRVAPASAESRGALTYGSLRTYVDGFAAEPAARGVGPGGAVALLCPDVPAFAVAFHGILRAGATVTTVNVLSTASRIAGQPTASQARTLVTVTALASTAGDAARLAGLDADATLRLAADRPQASGGPAPARRAVQEGAGRRVRHGDPQVVGGQDPAQGTAFRPAAVTGGPRHLA